MEKDLRRYLPGGRFVNVTPRASRNFSAVRGRNNLTTEVRFRFAMVRAGIRGWKLQPSGLPGNPDFIFVTERVAVFVDGCFWHGCPVCGHIPKTNSGFWRAKIQRNINRDRQNNLKLRVYGYRVLRIWEHELKINAAGCVARAADLLRQKSTKR